jgi:CspA family cold shock protein
MKGKVKFYNETKGFGFITGEDKKEYFVHSSDITGGMKLKEGDMVEFQIAQGDKGMKATKVVKEGQGNKSKEKEKEEPKETEKDLEDEDENLDMEDLEDDEALDEVESEER